jgi:rifampicin phosphotransferase
LKTLDELTAADLGSIGGKAYNCARLKQAGFPVPDGIVIPKDVADRELRELPGDPWFDTVPADTRFAVRSSGIGEDSEGHSFAGVHETQLNVERSGLTEAVVLCRRSAGSDQARAYRDARQLADGDVAIGVLVQCMVPAVTSGVAFTINPVTGADDIVVNAAWGLGEALVSGRVDPDEFTLSKRDAEVMSERLGVKNGRTGPTLSHDQLRELGGLLSRIEQHYGAPQDIEWCHDGRRFWIVQARPVTAATRPNSELRTENLELGTENLELGTENLELGTENLQLGTQNLPLGTQNLERGTQNSEPRTANPEPERTPNPAAGTPNPETEWTRANLAEVLPDQMSPQCLDAYETMLNRGQQQFMGRLLAPFDELGPMFKVFNGRMYMNLSQMRRVATLIMAPTADLLRSLGHPEQIKPEDEIPTRAPLREILRCLPDFIRVGSYDVGIERVLRKHEARIREMCARFSSVDPRALSDRELMDAIEQWIESAPEAIQPVFVMSGVLARETAVRKLCNRVGFSYDRLVYPQLAAGARSVSTQQAFDLVALATAARHDTAAMAYLLKNDGTFSDFRSALAGTSFLEALDRFLDEYGHRGRYESDWALPRMHENPAAVLFAIREQLDARTQDPKAISDRQTADANAAWRAFEARLTWWQRWTILPQARALIRRLKKQYGWREQVRSDLTRILRYMRGYHLALAERFVERGWLDRRDDYFLLRLDEIAAVIGGVESGPGLRGIAARRAVELAEQKDLPIPMLMRESELPALMRRPAAAPDGDADVLTGLCVSPGAVNAEIVVMKDPSEFATMKRGAILVAPATDPSWTPLFTLASGVIVEVGGMLSHASTIAREYGLPALANVKDATRILKTGDRVALDASGGRVTRGRPQSEHISHVSRTRS